MSEMVDPSLLKHFLTEDLYLVPEKTASAPPSTEAVTNAPQNLKEPEQKVPGPVESKIKEPALAQAPTMKGNVLILLKSSFGDLESSQQVLLRKITAAVQVDIELASLLSEKEYRARPEQLDDFQHVLTFGVTIPQCSSKYNVKKTNDQFFLASDSLAALEQAIALKGKLWKAMQQMFVAS